MNQTELTIFQNEARLLTIKVYQVNDKQQLVPFKPLEATIEIRENKSGGDEGDVVLEETPAGITGLDENQIFFLITPSNFTKRIGEFKVVWKMMRGSEIFYHKTTLEVREL